MNLSNLHKIKKKKNLIFPFTVNLLRIIIFKIFIINILGCNASSVITFHYLLTTTDYSMILH